MDRLKIQRAYIRYCRDSLFSLDAVNAAIFTAGALRVHPLEVWLAMPCFDDMERIASGNHPALTNELYR
jgi:hypothetical protein